MYKICKNFKEDNDNKIQLIKISQSAIDFLSKSIMISYHLRRLLRVHVLAEASKTVVCFVLWAQRLPESDGMVVCSEEESYLKSRVFFKENLKNNKSLE